MLPFTLNLHRKTGWSNVVRSDTSSLGPILCRDTVLTDPAGLVSEVKPAGSGPEKGQRRLTGKTTGGQCCRFADWKRRVC